MRVGIIYDSFLENGGGEKSILITAKKLKADIFTAHVNWNEFDESNFPNHLENDVFTSGLKFKNHKILTFTESAFRLRNWLKKNKNILKNDYDVFLISGMYGISGSFLHPNCHLCLSPPRSLYSEYEIIKQRLDFPSRQIFQIWVKLYKKYDLEWVKGVDKFLAISEVVNNRIKKYYNRESNVVYLPVETKKYKCRENKGYWFCPNRLQSEKRVGMVVKTFQSMPNERLVVAGDGSEREKIVKMVRGYDNISYVGNLDYEEMIKWYSNCKGTICMSQHEDLGLIPIESMASGKPCIIPRDGGGLTESVIHNQTGWMIYPNTDSLKRKVKSVKSENIAEMKKACLQRAKFFDVDNYIKRIKENLKFVIEND